MQFVSVRVISDDVARLAGFYEKATGLEARRPAERFAEIPGPSCTLAIGGAETMASLSVGTVIFEFRVEDVDREYDRVRSLAAEIVQEPTTMPWGNRSLLFRDPDGNLINYFSPSAP
ncbi:VOC family protein [Amycolatopsis pittospori]|uniref:VOC family protein n=1 Tax=Amycolatopsis pittospori TaxID=2749434 RepID=UPI0015F03404|nr:VOC family protein [Amycolatopsis pittospori]